MSDAMEAPPPPPSGPPPTGGQPPSGGEPPAEAGKPSASDPFSQYEEARKALELAYSKLSLSDQLRADRGTFTGVAVSIALGLLLHSVNLLPILTTVGSLLIPEAFAQANEQQPAGQHLPLVIEYLIYLSLLTLLLGSFYLGAFRGSQSMYVRDTWKTLLGFFIGILTK